MGAIECYQPLGISETIWGPEPGLFVPLSLELDENAWKIQDQKLNRFRRLFLGSKEPSRRQTRPRMERRGKM